MSFDKIFKEKFDEMITESFKQDDKAVIKDSILSSLEEISKTISTVAEEMVNEQVNTEMEKFEAKYREDYENIKQSLTEKLQDYLENAKQEEIKARANFIVSEARNSIVEDFYNGIKSLMEQKGLDIPVDQKDKIDQLSENVEDLKAKLNTAINEKIQVEKDKELEFKLTFENVSAELSKTEKMRFYNVCKGFPVNEELEGKMKTMLENFKTEDSKQEETIDEDDNSQDQPQKIEESVDTKDQPSDDDYYARFLKIN